MTNPMSDLKKPSDDKEKWLCLIKVALDYNADIVAMASMTIAAGGLKRSSYKRAYKQLTDRADKYVETCKQIVEW